MDPNDLDMWFLQCQTTFPMNKDNDTNAAAMQPVPITIPNYLVTCTITPMLSQHIVLFEQTASVLRQHTDIGHPFELPQPLGLDQSDQYFVPLYSDEANSFGPGSLFSLDMTSTLTDSSIYTASPLEAQSPCNDPRHFPTCSPVSQGMFPGPGFISEAMLQSSQQSAVNSLQAPGTSLHQGLSFPEVPILPAEGGAIHSSHSSLAPIAYHQPPVLPSSTIQRRQNRRKITKAGHPPTREVRRRQRPEKCPFPRCQFYEKGQAYRTDVRRHIYSKHRESLQELSDHDMKMFDLINNPPKDYYCEVEKCSHSLARGTFKGFARPDHLTRHMTVKHGRPKQKGKPSAIPALQS